ncbi:hypothetical protein C2G38_2217911 [Gigaspora rosea]|uniref:Uncharacterized protein n=1 Tax=Gigaspora rosea TaxID=44941 RepID=A0A397UAJ4_9GLOM|nr:hypothetical protein C2G38_2217911 [Gigaspora rosea]
MSSIFIAFCFIKTISGNDKFTTGTALYRANDEDDEFREFTYKGFTGNTDLLIIEFENNSIVLMIGRYIYHENAEYMSFSTLPIRRQSFMLSKKLYNLVNGQKSIDSNVIVSYSNTNGQYDSLKDSLKKSVISAIGRLKLNPILSQYATIIDGGEITPLNKKFLLKLLKLFDSEIAIMFSQDSNKRKKTSLFASLTKNFNNNPPTIDLPDLVNQIRTNIPQPQPSQESSANRAEP